MSSRCINDYYLKILLLELLHSFSGNHDRIHLGIGALKRRNNATQNLKQCYTTRMFSRTIERYPCFSSILLELIEGSRTERVGTNKTRLPSFPLVVVRHLNK